MLLAVALLALSPHVRHAGASPISVTHAPPLGDAGLGVRGTIPLAGAGNPYSTNYYAIASNGTPATLGVDPPLNVGGGWQRFSWVDAPGAFNVEGPFTFTSTDSTTLRVTDAFTDGDQFRVFDFGVPIGTTSAPADDGFINPDPNADFTDSRFSSGTFLLAPGSHSIALETIAIPTALDGPETSGAAFLEADNVSAVPEPATCILFGIGVATMAGVGYRRRNAA